MQLNKTGPSAPGSKKIPEGAPNCLRGLTFVFTGELSSIDRDQSSDLVRRYGGRVTSAVSGKTSYLVVGEKDVGATKTKKADSLGTPTLDEDAFLALIASKPAQEDDFGPMEGKRDSFSLESPTALKRIKTEAPPIQEEHLKRSTRRKAPKDTQEPITMVDKGKNRPQPATPAAAPPPQLWTEKHAPKTVEEFCGNKGIVTKLIQWLHHFQPFPPGGKRAPVDGAQRAVLLSGPPGLGKTTAAKLAAKEAGYRIWELNASDARNQAVLRDVLGVGTVTRSVEGGRVVLVMDEVDGMSSGDRGGVATLIQALRTSRIPIICICNDRQATNVRSLANYCLDLRFRRPDAQTLRSRLLTIAYREGLRIPTSVMDSLATASNSDFRLILNTLSAWAAGREIASSEAMSWDEGKTLGGSMNKHILLGPFDAAQRLLSASTRSQSSLEDRIGLHFMDIGLVPLMVQENYARMTGGSLEAMSVAADSISDSDLLDSLIHSSNQQWSLAPAHGMMASVIPGTVQRLSGAYLSGRLEFAGFLGKLSKTGKSIRMLRQLHLHMSTEVSSVVGELREDYLPVLSRRLLGPLAEQGQLAIPQVLDEMEKYHITREDVDFMQEILLSQPPSLPTAVKSAFTREYNKVGHRDIAVGGLKGSGKITSSAPSSMSTDMDEVVDEDVAEEEEEEEEEDDGAEAFKTKRTGRGSKVNGPGKGKKRQAAPSSSSGTRSRAKRGRSKT
ncbi:replication factor RFC1 C terminal domain-containing protein [Piptocephalis cylindrospora]|uniref:Replication factor C subunit 1 n=1 Tax=Piptocephalis cylindrospora TaxID=1907219 RepID=A0A4P9Y737_9FUNG|nr:replication factor RFC1 C terminal domain-containing protein [Piptocephalis cylindrospora]|eukprot:RKP14524.1 replication factor RFC1 C terminal domain-containing protein [Piptocephalis cylindrospora]